jgi:hypothetical protein
LHIWDAPFTFALFGEHPDSASSFSLNFLEVSFLDQATTLASKPTFNKDNWQIQKNIL